VSLPGFQARRLFEAASLPRAHARAAWALAALNAVFPLKLLMVGLALARIKSAFAAPIFSSPSAGLLRPEIVLPDLLRDCEPTTVHPRGFNFARQSRTGLQHPIRVATKRLMARENGRRNARLIGEPAQSKTIHNFNGNDGFECCQRHAARAWARRKLRRLKTNPAGTLEPGKTPPGRA